MAVAASAGPAEGGARKAPPGLDLRGTCLRSYLSGTKGDGEVPQRRVAFAPQNRPVGKKQFDSDAKSLVNTFDSAEQTWTDAMATLGVWVPSLRSILQPEQLDFKCVSSIMASVPDGFQSFGIVDSNAAFIGRALDHCAHRPSEVIIIPDCGMVDRLPFRLPVSELARFIDDYEQASPRMGFLDGASDIFFAFDTGDMLLVDHDERVWFTPSPADPIQRSRSPVPAVPALKPTRNL